MYWAFDLSPDLGSNVGHPSITDVACGRESDPLIKQGLKLT